MTGGPTLTFMAYPSYPPAKKERSENFANFVLVAVAAAVLLIFPLLVAVAVFTVVGRRLRWFETLALSAVAWVAFALQGRQHAIAYAHWVAALVGYGPGSSSAVPYRAIVLAGFGVGLLLATLRNTRPVADFLGGVGRITPRLKFRKKDTEQAVFSSEDGLIPSAEQRQRLRAVVPPGTSLTIDPETHSLGSAAVVGTRDFPIGLDGRGRPVHLNENEVRYHGLIFGSTGAGKTKTIQQLMAGLLDLGWSGMVLDLKEDTQTGGFRDWCREYAEAHSLPFQQIYTSQENPDHWFSPLYGLGPDKARDVIMSLQDFEAAHYKALNEKQLGQLLALMFAAHEIDPVRYPAPTMYDAGKILSANDLPSATKQMVALVLENAPHFVKSDFNTLISPDKDFIMASTGMGARMTAMYETEVGRRVLRPSGGRPEFDVTRPGITYVGLDSLGTPQMAKVLSSAVLLRMSAFMSDRIQGRIPTPRVEGTNVPVDRRFLIVDEANFVNREILLNILSRARDAWIPVFLCTQAATDWLPKKAGDPDMESLLNNTNINLIMNQGDRKNAEICADIIGREERTETRESFRHGGEAGEVIGMTTSTSTDITWVVDPEKFRSLGVGELVMRVSKPRVRIEFASVVARDPGARVAKFELPPLG